MATRAGQKNNTGLKFTLGRKLLLVVAVFTCLMAVNFLQYCSIKVTHNLISCGVPGTVYI